MYNKESLYREVHRIREYMGLSPNDSMIDIIGFCASNFKDIIMEEIPLKTHGLHGMMIPPSKNAEPYIILLNSYRNEIEKRFDYTHELMHIALHKDIKRNFNCFDDPKQAQDRFIEWEANEGAAEFLLPYKLFIPIYVRLSKIHAREWLNSPPTQILSKRFNVTEAVVSNRIRSLNYEIYQYLHGVSLDEIKILSATKLESIGWKKSHAKRYCINCLSPVHRGQLFCHICGQKFPVNMFKRLAYIAEGAGYMIYDGIKIDENGKAIECPVCHNEQILEGSYCQICGGCLINKCDSEGMIDNGVETFYCSSDHSPLPGNARYCPICGQETTFKKMGVLAPWNKIIDQKLIDIIEEDDSLPF